MRQAVGWIYREPGAGVTPARLKVKIGSVQKVFDDNNAGANELAAYVTTQFGDNWKLEDMYFLGYRIIVEDGRLPTHGNDAGFPHGE